MTCFGRKGSIRMARGKGKKIGWTDRTDESADSLDNLGDEKRKTRSRRKKRSSIHEDKFKTERVKQKESSMPDILVDRKYRSRSSRSGSEVEEDSLSSAKIAGNESPVFDSSEGRLLASTPIESPPCIPPEYLSPSLFRRDDPNRRSYDEASLIAEKELKNEPNFELRCKPTHKSSSKCDDEGKKQVEYMGRYEVQPDVYGAPIHKPSSKESRAKSRNYSSYNESEQEVSVDLSSEVETRSEASSIDLSPVAGVSHYLTTKEKNKSFEARYSRVPLLSLVITYFYLC